jgi:flagellar capping protein FliD
MSEILDFNSSINKAKEGYETVKEDIAERLSKLDVRENLITTQYTERFGEMEKSMTQFNSTKTLLENFIEAWKKQK